MTAEPQVADPESVERLAGAVDAAAEAVSQLDPAAREAAEALRTAIDDVHRTALTTIVRRLRADDRGRELLFDLVDDPVVHLALLVNGIVRPDPMTQARQALASVLPMIQSHGGDVSLVRVDERVAYVELHGACNGCSMSAQTLREGIERAIVEQVPAIDRVEMVEPAASPTLIPLGQIGVRTTDSGWVDAGPVTAVARGEMVGFTLSDEFAQTENILVVNIEGRLSAYLNVCAHMEMPLDDGLVDEEAGTLTCPWHAMCYDATSGECLSLPGAQLESRPLRVEGDHLWIRLG